MTDKEKELIPEDFEQEPLENGEFPEDTELNSTAEGATVDIEGALRAENAELRDKYLRLLADFENFKRRSARERMELIGTAAQATMSALLPVLDDFDRAKQNAEREDSTEQFSEGVSLVYQKLNNVLRQRGLEAMESTGEPFNAEFHEAVTEIPAPTEALKGKVVDTIEKGYVLNGKIIRHAKVVVGK